MRRVDREVKNYDEIIDILNRCNTIRLGIDNYIVPLSFGFSSIDKNLKLFIHGALSGKKAEMIKDGLEVFIESDIFYQYKETNHGITTLYESVMAEGIIRKLTQNNEKLEALKQICKHCGFSDYKIEESSLDMTNVYVIEVSKITAKRNK